jgi:hypothetical protein
MHVGMRPEGGKARCRIAHAGLAVVVTLGAGLHPVIRMDAGFGVVMGADVVTVMAIDATCRIGVPQSIDLAVIGIRITGQRFLVATATGIHIAQFEPSAGRVYDLVRRVTVGAHGGFCVAVFEHRFTVN